MIFRYTIIDRNGVQQEIDEPVNGDSISASFTRNMVNHGIISNINTGGLQYYNDGYDILRNEYDTHGADGRMELLIEYYCDETWIEFFRGKYDFNTYKRECGDKCFITCDVINSRCVDLFLTRFDQDVNIDATTDMDGNVITPLVPDVVRIDGQDVLLQNKSVNDEGIDCVHNGSFLTTGLKALYFPIHLPRIVLNEFGDFNVNNATCSGPINPPNGGAINFGDPTDWDEYGQFLTVWERTTDPLNCIDNDATINYRVKGEIVILPDFDGELFDVSFIFAKYDINTYSYTAMNTDVIPGNNLNQGFQLPIPFDVSWSLTPSYPEAEYLLFFIQFRLRVDTAPPAPNPILYDLTIKYDSETYLEMLLNSTCDPTFAQSYRLDEVYEWLSKPYVGEDCFDVVVKDDFPGSYPTECFQNYHITNGLHIRQVTVPSTPNLFLNWRQLFDGTRKIFNHGWGFTNFDQTLLVAPIKEFYQVGQVIDLGSIKTVDFSTAKDMIYGIIDVGYNKWEAEEYNGLDETNTARQYRRNVQNSQIVLDLMCDIITAGYTIEITRRRNQAKTGTEDWRYDNDLFLINTEFNQPSGFYWAERGVDFGAANLFSPTTRMNYRLTPARMMLNWFKSACAARPTYANDVMKFSSGTGNYIAEGQMIGCTPESRVISESQDLELADNFITFGDPIWDTIVATFDAPMTMAQYQTLRGNPYGRISFSCGATTYEGYIMSLELTPKEGLAGVKLLLAR